jgi:hypothetical protein
LQEREWEGVLDVAAGFCAGGWTRRMTLVAGGRNFDGGMLRENARSVFAEAKGRQGGSHVGKRGCALAVDEQSYLGSFDADYSLQISNQGRVHVVERCRWRYGYPPLPARREHADDDAHGVSCTARGVRNATSLRVAFICLIRGQDKRVRQGGGAALEAEGLVLQGWQSETGCIVLTLF